MRPRLGHGPHQGAGPEDGGAATRTGEPLTWGVTGGLTGRIPYAHNTRNGDWADREPLLTTTQNHWPSDL